MSLPQDVERLATESTATNDEGDSRRSEFRQRQLFASAQEHFAAADYLAARDCLQQIPLSAQSADSERLVHLVKQRLIETAALRREIQAARRRNDTESLHAKLQRLLELQPADEEALSLQYELDERTNPSPPTRSFTAEEPAWRSEAREKSPTVAPDVVTEEQEIWEFGERLTQTVPPPLPGQLQPDDYDFRDDDFLGEERASSAPMWIALSVSGAVILLAVVVTVIVLLAERAG